MLLVFSKAATRGALYKKLFLQMSQYSQDIKKHIPVSVKGAILGLRQFLATESSLKMMKNAFYFTLKALFVLKVFKFLS